MACMAHVCVRSCMLTDCSLMSCCWLPLPAMMMVLLLVGKMVQRLLYP